MQCAPDGDRFKCSETAFMSTRCSDDSFEYICEGVQHKRETFLKECSSNQVSAGIFCQGTGKRILSLSLPVNNYYPAKVAKAKT